jgi:hypothetical protein
MYRSRSHFSDRHYEGAMSGPFSFLNPTIRRSPISVNNQPKSGSATSAENTTNGEITGYSTTRSDASAPKGEMRASAVEQNWRSRDNRKGIWSYDTSEGKIILILSF